MGLAKKTIFVLSKRAECRDCDAMEEVEALRLELERKDILIAMLRDRVLVLATELDSRPHRD